MSRDNAAALATVHRCRRCGAWTCAPKWQRTTHNCERRCLPPA